MSRLYVYDGSFPGLLTVLHLLRERGEDPEDIRSGREELQESLLAETVRVETDWESAESLSRDIREHISPGALRRAFRAFLSETEGAGYHIYRYLSLGWELGADVDARLGDEHVHAVHAMARRTGREAHRMRGFLRFRQLGEGLLYAPMEPECDVLVLVAPHFLARMGDRDWIIHDLAREQAAACRDGALSFHFLPDFRPRLTADEEACQELWRGYYRAVAVAERRNPRLQKSCMPAKYWKMLVEEPGRLTRPHALRERGLDTEDIRARGRGIAGKPPGGDGARGGGRGEGREHTPRCARVAKDALMNGESDHDLPGRAQDTSASTYPLGSPRRGDDG